MTAPRAKPLVALVGILALIAGSYAQAPAPLGMRIAAAARHQIGVTKEYDPSYTVLDYPGGDVPLRTGVCSDVVVRALRGVGIDLQKEVHEDMQNHFRDYPQKWGLKGPDKNIDHRRVANLMKYFERCQLAMNEKLDSPEMYHAGDIVAWDLGGGILHIGVISDKTGKKAPLVIHNIGAGAAEEDVLFRYHIIGHYRIREQQPAAGAPRLAVQPQTTPSR
jgi:uncharacterized protein YijF (DUF1287 family)